MQVIIKTLRNIPMAQLIFDIVGHLLPATIIAVTWWSMS